MRMSRICVYCILILSVLSVTGILASAIQPRVIVPAPPMDPSHPYPGSVSGRITRENASIGVADAFVAIVDVENQARAYYMGTADDAGYYNFSQVNNTGNNDTYELYASDTYGNECRSNPFSVDQNTTTCANGVIGLAPTNTPAPTATTASTQTTTPTPTSVVSPTPSQTQTPVTTANATPATAIGQNLTSSPSFSPTTTTVAYPSVSDTAPALANVSGTASESASGSSSAPGFEGIISLAGLTGVVILYSRIKR